MIGQQQNYQCSTCRAWMQTEREAVDHQCGFIPPEPTLADLPMTTREATMILANQLANIVEELQAVKDAIIAVAGQNERLADMLDNNNRYNPIYTQDATDL